MFEKYNVLGKCLINFYVPFAILVLHMTILERNHLSLKKLSESEQFSLFYSCSCVVNWCKYQKYMEHIGSSHE